MKLLLVDDDITIHQLIKKFVNPLISLKCELALPPNPKALTHYDLVILDLMLAENKSSLEFLSTVKASFPEFLDQIILLTGSGSVETELEVHKLGVRDYIKKPFDPRVLSAVIDKHLANIKKGSIELRYGPFCLHVGTFQVFIEGEKELELSATEFKVLKMLIESKGRVVTRERLLTEVWNIDDETQTRTVDMHISTLRKKLGSSGEFIKTRRGIGYFIGTDP